MPVQPTDSSPVMHPLRVAPPTLTAPLLPRTANAGEEIGLDAAALGDRQVAEPSTNSDEHDAVDVQQAIVNCELPESARLVADLSGDDKRRVVVGIGMSVQVEGHEIVFNEERASVRVGGKIDGVNELEGRGRTRDAKMGDVIGVRRQDRIPIGAVAEYPIEARRCGAAVPELVQGLCIRDYCEQENTRR